MNLQQVSIISRALTNAEMFNAYQKGSDIENHISETYNIGDTVIPHQFVRIVDIFESSDVPNDTLNGININSEVISFVNNIYVAVEEALSDSVTLSDTITGDAIRIAIVAEQLLLSDPVNDVATLLNRIATVLTLHDVVISADVKTINDGLQLNNSIVNTYNGYVSLIDNTLFSDTPRLGFTVFVTENLTYSETNSQLAFLKNIIEDRINFFAGLSFGSGSEEQYLTYAINTLSTGISEYQNYNFNSFSYPFAATNTGIYLLDDSSTDDGTNIDSLIRTGVTDFGTSKKKQVPYAYLGVEKGGQIILKTITSNSGIKTERWYEVRSYADAIDTTRVQLGKGIKARYWQFELYNIDGNELNIESVEMLPIALTRRKS